MRRREMCSFHIPLYVAKYTTQAGVHCLAWGQVERVRSESRPEEKRHGEAAGQEAQQVGSRRQKRQGGAQRGATEIGIDGRRR
jgi:hypothetical protein